MELLTDITAILAAGAGAWVLRELLKGAEAETAEDAVLIPVPVREPNQRR